MTKSVLLFAVALIASSLFAGCEQQSPDELHASGKPYREVEAMRTCLVKEQGLSKKSLVIRDTVIVYQGDILFPIEDFRESYGEDCTNKPIKE